MIKKLEDKLNSIRDDSLIYSHGGNIVIETIISKIYPDIDIDFLATLLADYLFDWDLAIKEYIHHHEKGDV